MKTPAAYYQTKELWIVSIKIPANQSVQFLCFFLLLNLKKAIWTWNIRTKLRTKLPAIVHG